MCKSSVTLKTTSSICFNFLSFVRLSLSARCVFVEKQRLGWSASWPAARAIRLDSCSPSAALDCAAPSSLLLRVCRRRRVTLSCPSPAADRRLLAGAKPTAMSQSQSQSHVGQHHNNAPQTSAAQQQAERSVVLATAGERERSRHSEEANRINLIRCTQRRCDHSLTHSLTC